MGSRSTKSARDARVRLDAHTAFLPTLLDTVDALVAVLDREGRIVRFNPACERLTGWREDEVLGRVLWEFLLPPDEMAPVLALIRDLSAGRFPARLENDWITRDGQRRRIAFNCSGLLDDHGEVQFLLGCGIDVTERRRSEAALVAQRDELLEVSTPVVRVWEGVVLVPLIGTLDGRRTERLMDRLLNAIVETRSPIAILDITGVPVVDTETARYLVETIRAVRLLGARTVLSGVRPAIAQTLVHLGIDLSGVETRASLVDALRWAQGVLGNAGPSTGPGRGG